MEKQSNKLPLGEKYLLTVREASEYFNIGLKNMRRIADSNEGNFTVHLTGRTMINRPQFEKYILQQGSRVVVIDGWEGED